MKSWQEIMAEGSHHKKRQTIIMPDPQMPSCPEWLSPRAKEIWAELAPELFRMGLLVEIDRGMFAVLCSNQAHIEELMIFIQKNGAMHEVKYGRHKPVRKMRPETRLYFSMSEAQLDMYKKFGMTPKSRIRILGRV